MSYENAVAIENGEGNDMMSFDELADLNVHPEQGALFSASALAGRVATRGIHIVPGSISTPDDIPRRHPNRLRSIRVFNI